MTPGDPVAITRGARVLFRAVVERIAWPGGDIILTDVRRIDGRAVHALGERCVLSVPPGDNLRVARMPRGVGP